MKQRLLLCVFLMLLCSLWDVTYAVPGRRRPVQKTLPDGSLLTIVVNGDEHRNWITTGDGYTVQQKKDGFFYYVEQKADTLRCTDVKASEPIKRTSEERTFLRQIKKSLLPKAKKTLSMIVPKSSSPVIEPGKAGWLLADNPYRSKPSLEYIVVPVSYPDKPLKYTQADLERLCNESGLKDWGLVGSVKDFFEDMSFGKFSAHAKVMPVYQTQNKYGTYGKYGNMDTEIVNYLESHGIYWTDISKHGAPIIAVVFPGFSQSDTGDEKDIWANQHSIEHASKTVYVNYATILYTPEFDNYPEEFPGTYTFCHEFSHALGVPDLYDTNYETDGQHFNHFGWDVMVGSIGRNAPSHNSFIRYKLGWMENAIELNKPLHVSLKSVEEEQCGYFFRAGTKGEFFWLENRQKNKWNSDLPGYGMLVYHVDSVTWFNNCKGEFHNGMVIGWSGRNQINGNASRPGFDLEEADGVQSWDTQAGDCFPGSTNTTSFTDNTTPGASDYAGTPTNKPLTNMTLKDGAISFDFMGGGGAVAEVLTSEVCLTAANSMTVRLDIKKGEGAVITECGVYYGLTAALQSNKVVGTLNGNKGEVILDGMRNNMNYYLRSYIVMDGVTIKDAVRTMRTSLSEINSFPVIYDFTKSETINTVTPLANVEGYLPSMSEQWGQKFLSVPLSSKIVFPMMNVQLGKELYIRFQNTTYIPTSSFTPYLYYRYGYQDEWRNLKDELALICFTPEHEQIQFAIGAEQEYSYYFGSYVNHNFPPYYERNVSYTPVLTFTDKLQADWIIKSFPFMPVYKTEDFSLWGAVPNGSEYSFSPDEYSSEDYRLLDKDEGYFSSDILLPMMQSSVLNKPVMRFFYDGDAGTGLYIDYRVGQSKEWVRLNTDYLLAAASDDYHQEYMLKLPKVDRLQIRIRNISHSSANYGAGYGFVGSGMIHHLRVGEAEDLSVANAGVIDEKPAVKVELASKPEDYQEYGILVNGNKSIPCKDARQSISFMRVPDLADQAMATIKVYAKTKDGRTIYSPDAVTVTQPVRTTTAQKPTVTFVDNRGKYSVLRSMYYPGGKEILIQGLCWTSSYDSEPTVENNEGLFIIEDSQLERIDSIVPAKSGTVYRLRAFRMCEGDATYTYGNPVEIRSGATGQQELTLPFSFTDCSQADLDAYWRTEGNWHIQYGRSLDASFLNYVPVKTFRIVTPLIRKKLTEQHALKLTGIWKGLRVYLIDEKTHAAYEAECCISGQFDGQYEASENYFKLPAGLEEFRIAFDIDNAYGSTCSLTGFTIEVNNNWCLYAEEANKDEDGNYLIASSANLAWMAIQTHMNRDWSLGKSFIQTDNIDLADHIWFPIGISRYPNFCYFSGQYDGKGHYIAGLTINSTTQNCQGLFGCLKDAVVRGVHLKSGNVSGGGSIGGLAGYAVNSVIEDCTNAVHVAGKSYYIGGIIGQCYNNTITACINYGAVSGSEDSRYVGGITGENRGSIVACANLGEVTGNTRVGGVCGANAFDLYGVFNAGRVTAVSDQGAIGGDRSGKGAGVFYDKKASSDGGYLMGFDGGDGISQSVTEQQLKSREILERMNNAILGYTSKYSWKADPNGGYPVLDGGTLVSIDAVTEDAGTTIQVVSAEGKLYVTTFEEETVCVYSSEGYLVKSLKAESGTYELCLDKGVYLIRSGKDVVKALVY